MMYLLHEAPPEEQNFAMIMEMLGSAQVKEDDEEYESPLGIYRGAEKGSKAGNGCPCYCLFLSGNFGCEDDGDTQAV